MRGRYIRKSLLLRLSIVVFVMLVMLPSAVLATEFVTNGGLIRALAGGGRCETSANAFGSWTLSGGCTWYDEDALKSNTMGGVNPDEPKIVQPITVPGNLTYTLTFRHVENEYKQSGSNVAWNLCWGKATVYYYANTARTLLIGSDTTGNLTCSQKNVWATATMTKTTPANCVAAKVEIITHGVANGATYGFSNIDDISLAACVPIAITGNPQSQVKDVGQTATFSVTNTGESPGYVWEKKPSGGTFAAISGAISPSYTTPALTPGDSGTQYRCLVSNSCTSAYSNTATLTVISPVAVSSIAQAKAYEDGTVIRLPEKPVSLRTSVAYWIQDSDLPSGIKINSAAYPVAGSRVAVTGTLNSTAGERRIDPLTETWGTLGLAVKPYFLGTKSLGGAGLNEFSPGVATPFGPNNIGLFVKIYGTVKNLGSSYYYLDDGAGLKDGTLTNADENIGVRITAAPGALAANETTSATGVVSTMLSGDQIRPALVLPGCSAPNAALTVSSAASVLCSGQSTSVTVGSTESDVTYQLRNGSANVGSPVLGTGGTINLPTGNLTSTTAFNVLATRNVGGCSVQLTQTRTITVNALPITGLAVGAQQIQIDVGQSTNVTVANSQSAVNYQLRKHSDNSPVGSPVAGTGGTINLATGTMSTNGNYTFNVLATNTSGCSMQLTQTVMITVGQLGGLTGKVMNARGEALSGAVVSLSGGVYTATTNASGVFSMSNVVAGTYSMTASANTYQSHTWERVVVTANRTNPVPAYYLPRPWSKIGWHIQKDNTPRLSEDFFFPIRDAGKTCQMIKCMGVFGKADTAARDCPGSFSIGRTNDIDGVGDIQAFNEAWAAGVSPADQAWFVYYGTQKPVKGTGGLRNLMVLNPAIDVWEINNEWDSHYDWQADYTIAMMDLAEADGFRIAAFSSAAGTPSLDPNYKFSGDTRTELDNLGRVCARAKAHGGHMLALHEYAYGGNLREEYTNHPGALVGRYRLFHDYLKNYTATDDPANGWIGADCPIIITECVGDCSAGDQAVVDDMAWYDTTLVRQDSYVLGVATWNIGWECDLCSAFLEMSNYECGVN